MGASGGGGKRERERASSQSADSGDARKADCLFVGSFWCCAHKQVETNNILAALRERVGEGGRLRLPQGGGNEANECREPLPSLMPASGPRVPLSLPSPPPRLFSVPSIPIPMPSSRYESRVVSGSPFIFRGREEGEEESCVNRVFQSAGNRNWKLKNVRSMLDGSWLLYGGGGVGRRVARDRLEGGGKRRWGVRITRFLMTNDDVSRGRFVDRRGIERVSWYWTICFFFFFFEEKGEELSVIRMAIR